MRSFFDRTTLFVMASALVLVILSLSKLAQETWVFFLIHRAGEFADTLIHELGHTLFAWLFGRPTIPMIFTLFGSDQASGMAMHWEFSWFVQFMAFLLLAYMCYWLWDNVRGMFIPGLIFTGFVVAVAFSRHSELVILYMGHGGSILAGGFFLFRAWIYLDASSQIGRWFNAFFGFYLVLSSMAFSHGLAFDAAALAEYSAHMAFGASHNDFTAMASQLPGLSVKAITLATMALCIATLIGSLLLAILLQNQFTEVYDDQF